MPKKKKKRFYHKQTAKTVYVNSKAMRPPNMNEFFGKGSDDESEPV